jgi:protein-disulfide isomerase-like protein with CxxC motif
MKDSKDRIEKYDISGYPTIIIIDKNNSEKKVAEYNDERKYEKMKAFVSKYAGM